MEHSSPDSRRAVLHVGFHKTGSSTIQNVFHARRAEFLARWGIFYPSMYANLSHEFRSIFQGHPTRAALSAARRPDGSGLRTGTELRHALEEEVRAASWRTLVMSAESISAFSAAELSEARDWLASFTPNIDVIGVIREPGSWAASATQQRLKSGLALDWDARLPVLEFRTRLERFIEVFGRDRVAVFSLESAVRAEGALLGEFCRAADLPGELVAAAGQPPRDNESLSQAAAEVLDAMNSREPMFVNGARNRSPRQELAHLARLPGPKFTLPPKVTAAIRKGCADDVEWVRSTFGVDISHDPELESGDRPTQTSTRALDPELAAAIGDIILAASKPVKRG